MLRFYMGNIHRIQAVHVPRPSGTERISPRTGIKEYSMAAPAVPDKVGVDHSNTVRHPQRPYTKRQRADRGKWIAAASERLQSHFVQSQDACETTQLIPCQIRSIVHRIEDATCLHSRKGSK